MSSVLALQDQEKVYKLNLSQERIRGVEQVHPQKSSEKASGSLTGVPEGIPLPKPVSKDWRSWLLLEM